MHYLRLLSYNALKSVHCLLCGQVKEGNQTRLYFTSKGALPDESISMKSGLVVGLPTYSTLSNLVKNIPEVLRIYEGGESWHSAVAVITVLSYCKLQFLLSLLLPLLLLISILVQLFYNINRNHTLRH